MSEAKAEAERKARAERNANRQRLLAERGNDEQSNEWTAVSDPLEKVRKGLKQIAKKTGHYCFERQV